MVWLLCTTRGDFFIQSVPLPTFPPTFHVVELIWFYRCVGRLLTHSLLSVFCCMSTRCIDCLLDRWRRDGTLKIGLFRILESSLFCVTLCTKNKSKTSFPCRWNKLAAMQRDTVVACFFSEEFQEGNFGDGKWTKVFTSQGIRQDTWLLYLVWN